MEKTFGHGHTGDPIGDNKRAKWWAYALLAIILLAAAVIAVV